MNIYLNYLQTSDKLINKFILHSKKFVEWSAFSYGTADLLRHSEANNKYTYDHEYFNFTKSTKSLISIRALLKLNHNEDALILVRSIFENYLSSRFLNENVDSFKDFTIVLLKLMSREYVLDDKNNNIIKDRNGNKIADGILNPKSLKLGKDKGYYHEFYGILSTIGHSNYGIVNLYRNKDLTFNIGKNNYPLVTRFFTVFVFTKLFELIVTVEGEDFYNSREEENCYKLVTESLLFQQKLIQFIIHEIEFDSEKNPYNKPFNKKIKEMFKDMNKSLKEPLGSIDKGFLG